MICSLLSVWCICATFSSHYLQGKEVNKPESSPLYIWNPFEQDLNISKNVNQPQLEKFVAVARESAWILQKEDKTQQTINKEPWGLAAVLIPFGKSNPNTMKSRTKGMGSETIKSLLDSLKLSDANNVQKAVGKWLSAQKHSSCCSVLGIECGTVWRILLLIFLLWWNGELGDLWLSLWWFFYRSTFCTSSPPLLFTFPCVLWMKSIKMQILQVHFGSRLWSLFKKEKKWTKRGAWEKATGNCFSSFWLSKSSRSNHLSVKAHLKRRWILNHCFCCSHMQEASKSKVHVSIFVIVFNSWG